MGEVCAFLLDEKAKVNAVDQEHQSALMWAAAEGHQTACQVLIDNEAKVELVTKLGKTALLLACQFGRYDVARLLIDEKANIEHADADVKTVLFEAVEAGHPALLELLIQGVPIEARSKRGETPLIYAAMRQELQCVTMLLKYRANVHAQDENGQKAMDHAECSLNSNLVEVLR